MHGKRKLLPCSSHQAAVRQLFSFRVADALGLALGLGCDGSDRRFLVSVALAEQGRG